MLTIRTVVFDEHEVFRRGVLACLQDDPIFEIHDVEPDDDLSFVDVAIVSESYATNLVGGPPLVVCYLASANRTPPLQSPEIHGWLPRRSVTPDQLLTAVRAAASGLKLEAPQAPTGRLDERSRQVLGLLAEGADTREISQSLGYSERTIKQTIHGLQRELGVRNRAHAVAEAVRSGIL